MTADRPNLILVVFDTARRDRFGCYGYPRGTTPAVDALAGEALLFERMITPAPWTVPSHASLFTGLYPREHGAQNPVPMLTGSALTLAAHLRTLGYATVAVTNNALIYGETGLAAGFDDVRLRPGDNGRPRWLWRAEFLLGLTDSGAAATTQLVGELLPRLRRPFFLFINYLECHWAYLPPRRFARRFARQSWPQSVRYRLRSRRRLVWEAIAEADGSRLALYNDLYDAELATLDERFGRLLDHLRRAGSWEETALLLTSDHGENIGEDGLASHQGSLRQNLIHVPFLARIPGRRSARIGGLTQFTDVFAG
ncbi:MAG: sulfatase, partial [bacterium]